MKRMILTGVAAAMVVVAGCSPPEAGPGKAGVAPGAGWTRPPAILAVRRAQASLIFTGEAEPGARVVLRSVGDVAYAAAADAEGRFEIRMAAPARPVLLRPETQVGQDAAPSPDQLLILAGGRGPIALLRTGGAARRLDAAPALAAVDSDGRSLIASGRAGQGATVRLEAGGEAIETRPDASGRWRILLDRMAPGDTLAVGDARFVWPGPGESGEALAVERAGAGWRIGWSGPAGGRQWTWMPDGPQA